MSSIITHAGTIAGNLNVGVTGAVSWANPQNALVTSDSAYATNNFNHSSSPGITHYLYIHGFNLNLPTTALIDGFVVQVIRNGIGTTSDYYAGLVWQPAAFPVVTSPGRQLPGRWLTPDGTATYGSPTDTWGKNDWTFVQVNDPAFGFALSAQGNGTAGDLANVDYVTLSVYYHNSYIVTGSGGGACNGTADVSISYATEQGLGGAVGGGTAYPAYVGIPSGGALGDGSVVIGADLKVMTGGALGGSTAIVQVNYPLTTTGNGVVAGGTASPEGFIYDEFPTGVGSVGGGSAVAFADYSVVGQAGASVFIEVDPFVTYGSIGGALGGSSASIVVRDNITPSNQAAIGGGEADDTLFSANLLTSAGALGGGHVSQGITGLTSGGALGDGTSASVITPFTSGGAKVGSAASAVVFTTFVPPITGQGAVGGSTAVNTLFSANLLTGNGSVGGGQGVIGIQPSVTGQGSIGGGTGALLFSFTIVPVGGSLAGAGTTYILQQTYAAQSLVGGAKVRATAKYERLRIRTPAPHLHYALAMKDPNIANTPPATGSKLIDPIDQIAPPLSPSRFVFQHDPGWCDFGEACEAAYLPKIVQVRQGQYLPPKNGGESPGSDQLATATLDT